MSSEGALVARESEQGGTASARLHPHVKVLTRAGEFPNYRQVLSASDGALAGTDEERRVLAVLDLGAKQVCVVWTNRFIDRSHYLAAKARCTREKYFLAETMEAAPALIERFYTATSEEVVPESNSPGMLRADGFLDQIIVAALEEGALDIHWQVTESSCSIFFRTQGRMKLHQVIPRTAATRLARTAYTFTNGDSTFTGAETLSAEMTREVVIDGKPANVKLTWESHPTYPGGWDLTQRVFRLGQDGVDLDFGALGYDPVQIAAIDRACQSRAGLILIIGSAGAGKSTSLSTMAARWHARHQDRKKLVTIEDPVEYIIKGARQINVLNESGIEAALRTALRSDPDALLISDVRSGESAALARHAVNTGHLVMAAMHATSPLGAITRLLDLGVPSSVLADEGFLRLIIEQALIPVLCTACRVPWASACLDLAMDAVWRDQVERAFVGHLDALYVQNESGCQQCNHTGSAGLTAVAEFLVPDTVIRNLIPSFNSEASRARLTAYAYWRGGCSSAGAGVQGRTCMDQARERILAGLACPLAVQEALGLFDEQSSPEAELGYYEASRGAVAEPR